jgi:hypothetical protein
MEATMQWIEMLDLFSRCSFTSEEALEFMFCFKSSHLSTFNFSLSCLSVLCFIVLFILFTLWTVLFNCFSNFHCWWLHSNALWFPSWMGAYCFHLLVHHKISSLVLQMSFFIVIGKKKNQLFIYLRFNVFCALHFSGLNFHCQTTMTIL